MVQMKIYGFSYHAAPSAMEPSQIRFNTQFDGLLDDSLEEVLDVSLDKLLDESPDESFEKSADESFEKSPGVSCV